MTNYTNKTLLRDRKSWRIKPIDELGEEKCTQKMEILEEPTKKWRKETGYRIAKLCMKRGFRGTERVKRIDELNFDKIDEFYCTKLVSKIR